MSGNSASKRSVLTLMHRCQVALKALSCMWILWSAGWWQETGRLDLPDLLHAYEHRQCPSNYSLSFQSLYRCCQHWASVMKAWPEYMHEGLENFPFEVILIVKLIAIITTLITHEGMRYTLASWKAILPAGSPEFSLNLACCQNNWNYYYNKDYYHFCFSAGIFINSFYNFHIILHSANLGSTEGAKYSNNPPEVSHHK